MTTRPIDQDVAEAVKALTEDQRIEWEERASIREYDGHQPRAVAERNALIEIWARGREDPKARY